MSNVYQDARAQGMDAMINDLKTDFENGVRKQLFMKVILSIKIMMKIILIAHFNNMVFLLNIVYMLK